MRRGQYHLRKQVGLGEPDPRQRAITPSADADGTDSMAKVTQLYLHPGIRSPAILLE